jgi:hypothetical protein
MFGRRMNEKVDILFEKRKEFTFGQRNINRKFVFVNRHVAIALPDSKRQGSVHSLFLSYPGPKKKNDNSDMRDDKADMPALPGPTVQG